MDQDCVFEYALAGPVRVITDTASGIGWTFHAGNRSQYVLARVDGAGGLTLFDEAENRFMAYFPRGAWFGIVNQVSRPIPVENMRGGAA